MSKHLVIVESPAKAKTISRFLGKDYIVEASFGHVRDLPKSGMGVDIEHGFTPSYEISPDKKKRVSELKKLAKGVDDVWLASDADREGEAIAWHLCQALGLDPAKTKRVVFHEITEKAIKAAIAQPRTVDQHLVDAQQARRVLDRLVGYELSPVLWKKIQTGLSAGRVQSVAVRLIVEREREIENFEAGSAFKVTAEFSLDGGTVLRAELPAKFKTADEAQAFLQDCLGAQYHVASLETKPGKRTPAAPFTTSTLQQEASRKLGFSVRQTMVVAQKLYEAGKITYMRTDSVHLSDLALDDAAATIKKDFGDQYYARRQFTTKSAGAQEAHEAIRPTHFEHATTTGDRNETRLYELIWKRTVASQMAEAQLERTTALITISTRPEQLAAKGEVVVFDGFLKLYLAQDTDEEVEEEGILPPLTIGQALDLATIRAVQVYDRPKPRYTEASLVKRLEEDGIGRPSTYAPTITTIQDRQYVEKGDLEGKERPVKQLVLEAGAIQEIDTTETYGADRGKLFPTSVGMLVNDFLVAHFPDVIDYNFTAKVEDEFDEIAEGKQAWNRMIAEFYGPFHETVAAAETLSRQEASGARELGADPATGKPVIARLGRYGPMLQLGEATDDEKPKFAPMPAGRRLDEVTLEEALELFKLPRIVGQAKDGQDIKANFGRFGPYIQWGKLYASIKPDDPLTVTHERALELIAEKEAAEEAKYINDFPSGIRVLNGRFGPYITDGTKNVKVPKDTDPKALTEDQCKEMLTAAPVRAKRRRIVRPS
ncbi:MAG TPA: type I DNA topoisomerase [Candidatus Saccharimonadia bacterium]|nr:type I DNA topoisomerase [Candidatus Saccharimonadia bacterium]